MTQTMNKVNRIGTSYVYFSSDCFSSHQNLFDSRIYKSLIRVIAPAKTTAVVIDSPCLLTSSRYSIANIFTLSDCRFHSRICCPAAGSTELLTLPPRFSETKGLVGTEPLRGSSVSSIRKFNLEPRVGFSELPSIPILHSSYLWIATRNTCHLALKMWRDGKGRTNVCKTVYLLNIFNICSNWLTKSTWSPRWNPTLRWECVPAFLPISSVVTHGLL
jgi:hypothetical protein